MERTVDLPLAAAAKRGNQLTTQKLERRASLLNPQFLQRRARAAHFDIRIPDAEQISTVMAFYLSRLTERMIWMSTESPLIMSETLISAFLWIIFFSLSVRSLALPYIFLSSLYVSLSVLVVFLAQVLAFCCQ